MKPIPRIVSYINADFVCVCAHVCYRQSERERDLTHQYTRVKTA